MNVRTVAKYLDKTATWYVEGDITVAVKVLNVREVYGRLQFLITPLCGAGKKWADEAKVKVTEV